MDPTTTAPETRELTGAEREWYDRYDRQIRLWGVEAQRRLAESHVLITGTPCSLVGHELAKNVVLSGVARLGLCASGKSQGRGFLGSNLDATVASLRDMNPHVDIAVIDEVLPNIHQFRIVCAIGMTKKEELIIAEACREKGVAFCTGRTAGTVGWVFFDFGKSYKFQVKARKDPKSDTESVRMEEKEASFCTYAEAIGASWGRETRRSEFGWHVALSLLEFEEQHGRMPLGDEADQAALLGVYDKLKTQKKPSHSKEDFVQEIGTMAQFSIPPVAAIVGGMWGREVIKYASGKDAPINNFFFFNSKTSSGSLERLGPLE